MQKLNLPPFEYKLEQKEGAAYIFDVLRKKHVMLTPEEWVRQHFLHYLINALHYPKSLISIERGTRYNRLQKRTDLCVYNTDGQPHLLVECKAAHVAITQEVVKQVSVYNQTIQAKYVVITNGMQHFCWEVDFMLKQFTPLQQIPAFSLLS